MSILTSLTSVTIPQPPAQASLRSTWVCPLDSRGGNNSVPLLARLARFGRAFARPGLGHITQRLPVRYQMRAFDFILANADALSVHVHADLFAIHHRDLSAHPSATLARQLQCHLGLRAHEARELFGVEQRSLDARRGNFQHVMPRNRIVHV